MGFYSYTSEHLHNTSANNIIFVVKHNLNRLNENKKEHLTHRDFIHRNSYRIQEKNSISAKFCYR
jgi:hypothetical protein